MTTSRPAASITGLALAWGGTAWLISPYAHVLGDPARLTTFLLSQAFLWLLMLIVLLIVVGWERQPLASLWVRPWHMSSLTWGLLLVVINYAVFFPVGQWMRQSAGLDGFAAGMDDVMRLPVWCRVIAVIGAGVVEETLFRGFTVTRLAAITGRPWLAAALSVLGFGLLHVPGWGWGFFVGGLAGGVAAMTFFMWRRDLLAMIVFHLTTDAIGLVIAPAFGEWWKTPALS